jgi:hypothetical protein
VRIKIIGLITLLLGILLLTTCELPPECSIEWDPLSTVTLVGAGPLVQYNGWIENVGSKDLTGIQLEIWIDSLSEGEVFVWTPAIDLDQGEIFTGSLTIDPTDFNPAWGGLNDIQDFFVSGAGWDNPPD